MVAHLYPIHQRWLPFDNVAGRCRRHVRESPRFGNYLTNNFPRIIDPNNAQIKKNKEHVDSGVNPIVAGFHQHQPVLRPKLAIKGEASQLAAEAVAPACLGDEYFTTFYVNNLFAVHCWEV